MRINFLETEDLEGRTDNSFHSQGDEEHHKGTSPLDDDEDEVPDIDDKCTKSMTPAAGYIWLFFTM